MKTKTVEYWLDLHPNWHDPSNLAYGMPFLQNQAPTFPKCDDGVKRIKILVELPVWGDEIDLTVEATTSVEKEKGFQS